MYWRTDMALEVRECSDMTAEWNKNEKAWSVLADDGTCGLDNSGVPPAG